MPAQNSERHGPTPGHNSFTGTYLLSCPEFTSDILIGVDEILTKFGEGGGEVDDDEGDGDGSSTDQYYADDDGKGDGDGDGDGDGSGDGDSGSLVTEYGKILMKEGHQWNTLGNGNNGNPFHFTNLLFQ